MITSVYIKNFKKYNRDTFILGKHNIIIGENDAGKSTILQALDIFFNQEKIDKNYIINPDEPVEIGIRYNQKFYKNIYTGASHKVNYDEAIDDLSGLKYIYIPSNGLDVKQLIQQLAIAKTVEGTSAELLAQLKEISQNSINDVVNGIDRDLVVFDSNTSIIEGMQKFKYDASLKFDVTTSGIPIESRGSGFQKNIVYALLIGNNYNNVILGIDEIENSLSLANAENLMQKLQEKMGQTIFTTHSGQIVKNRSSADIIPLISSGNNSSLAELIKNMDASNEKKFVMVEGVYDLPWIKKAIQLLNRENEFIVLPSGGCSNINHLTRELDAAGIQYSVIKDGDTQEQNALSKDCIELYAPLESINRLFSTNLMEVPASKEEFFEALSIEHERTNDTVKAILASKVNEFLTIDNLLVSEVQNIISE